MKMSNFFSKEISAVVVVVIGVAEEK